MWPEIPGDGLGKALQRLQDRHDYRHIGGAPLLGVQKPVIVAHGRSHEEAMSNAILLAARLVTDRVYERLAGGLEQGRPAGCLETTAHGAHAGAAADQMGFFLEATHGG